MNCQASNSNNNRVRVFSLPWFRAETLIQRFLRTSALDTLPETITHERIYIVPSRRGWMFVGSLLVMLIGAINYSLSLGYALCFLLTGLFAASLIATYRNFSGLRVTRINQPEAPVNEPLEFNITLENTRTVTRSGIDIGNAEATVRVSVPAHQTVKAVLPMRAVKRGWQACGRLTLSSDFPLGLWFTWSYLHVDCNALVLPQLENSPPPLLYDHDNSSHGASRSAIQGDFESLREYHPGDSVGSIAWKTVARGMGLHTRQLSTENPGTNLTLDWQATQALANTENRLSRLAAWAALAQQNGVAWSLNIPGRRLSPGKGEQQLRKTLRQLALYGLDEDTALTPGTDIAHLRD